MDLERLPPAQADSKFRALGSSKAIIFDMRGYPQGTVFTLGPGIARADMPVPVAHFDRPERPSRDSSTFTVVPFDQTLPRTTAPKYTGRTVLLIDEDAVSQSEHSALVLRALACTTFLGSPTVGANGDITDFVMPGRLQFVMTGQSVKCRDGSVLFCRNRRCRCRSLRSVQERGCRQSRWSPRVGTTSVRRRS